MRDIEQLRAELRASRSELLADLAERERPLADGDAEVIAESDKLAAEIPALLARAARSADEAVIIHKEHHNAPLRPPARLQGPPGVTVETLAEALPHVIGMVIGEFEDKIAALAARVAALEAEPGADRSRVIDLPAIPLRRANG